jgi:hypothetical protein
MARPKLYNDVEKLEKDIDAYFKMCDKKERPYTMSGLALALNMDRRSLLNYSKDEKFFLTIKKAKQKVEAQLEENALMNKYNPTFTIFNLKNNFDWKDKMEVEANKEQLNKVEELLSKIKEEANDNN